jgi:hypothetical protein
MNKIKYTVLFWGIILIFSQIELNAQSLFLCAVDGKEFHGEVKEALLVNLGKENFIQVKLEKSEKIMYLYLKASKIDGSLPAKLTYLPYDNTINQTPEAEIVWVPDGPEQPSWNTIEGKAEVLSHNPDTKTLSGTFNFVVEKASYSSNKKSETLEISGGRFENIQYKLEEPKKK